MRVSFSLSTPSVNLKESLTRLARNTVPKYPQLGSLTDAMSAAVFSSLVSRLNTEGETFPLHVGDTWLDPTPTAQMQALLTQEHPDLHRYVAPHGHGPLRRALLERERGAKGAPIKDDQLLVTAGATAGLHCSLSAMLEPQDEVLVLAPHWPLIVGIVRACRGVPVTVDVLDLLEGNASDADAFLDRVERSLSPRTTALYLSSPNNPTGRVLPKSVLEALVAWAARHDLWVISDEVYEHYAFSVDHAHGAQFDPERTVSSYSFSKSYGLAGGRCGYITGPKALIAEAVKVGTHTFYSTPTMTQIAALHALRDGDEWLSEAKAAYRSVGEESAEILGVRPPEGGTFLFLDLGASIERNAADPHATPGLLGVLEACADRGLLLAPGPSFGPYPEMARFCFTCLEPKQTLAGARLLCEILD